MTRGRRLDQSASDALLDRSVPKIVKRTRNSKGNDKVNYKGKTREICRLFRRGYEGRCGEGERLLLFLDTQLLSLFSLSSPPEIRFRRLALCVILGRGWGPPSVAERKPRTAWLHLALAKRSRILNRSFPLPVSFRTIAHRNFCWAFR